MISDPDNILPELMLERFGDLEGLERERFARPNRGSAGLGRARLGPDWHGMEQEAGDRQPSGFEAPTPTAAQAGPQGTRQRARQKETDQ